MDFQNGSGENLSPQEAILQQMTSDRGLYVQYGCGLSAPTEWANFDVSPTLRIQKVPIIGALLRSRLNTTFPSNVRYGDIIRGLPVPDNSCRGVYCSHTLEHLSLEDFRKALQNTYRMLSDGGIFRCVLPDLEASARKYLEMLANGEKDASLYFMRSTFLGKEVRFKGMKGIAKFLYGNSNHLWMWDSKSLAEELKKVGFREIRNCAFNDCSDDMFRYVEDIGRFQDAVAIECKK